jgi:hypothetical protein
MNDAEKLARWKSELERLRISWRWGDTRRFHSNSNKLSRQRWLVDHIAAAETKQSKI